MTQSSSDLYEAAVTYHAAGLCVLPADKKLKYPSVRRWKPYQSCLPSEDEIQAWFGHDPEALCIVAGEVSGNLEMIDFDLKGEAFGPWCELVRKTDTSLLENLVIEQSPSGGWHVVYRCEIRVCGNMKLAQRSNGDGIVTLIETRGEGGLFLCSPTAGYELRQGEFTNLPVLTEAQRDILLEASWSLNEYWPQPVNGTPKATESAELRPGDDYNNRGDVRAVLTAHSWDCVKGGDNEYWRRPGKTSGWSATLRDGVFYVFSSNASPFEPNQSYSPFGVYALLEHGGDYTEAAQALVSQGYGEELAADPEVDISAILTKALDPEEATLGPVDPGPMPEELLYVPGFVGQVMDHCMATAPYPNVVMAFCGALALQAFLAGRKVRDSGDNRTNIYLLGLAHSAAGKDWPRKINTRILHTIGLSHCLGQRFASGEGIQDALFVNPCMLFQTDELDAIVQSINKAQDARHEAIMSTLLTMYSSASSVFPMRRKAGQDSSGAIDQPCLIIFGTAIPNHYYQALSERMLTNGFFARMVILECGKRGKGQEPSIRELPDSVVATAKWWSDFRAGTGNLEDWHPIPVVVEQSERAVSILVEARETAESEYAKAEGSNDAVSTTVWGRVSEQARKLALIYAVSENYKHPVIDKAAVDWAVKFMMHQTRRMLFMASSFVADNPFHAQCLKFIRKLQAAPGGKLDHSTLLKRMKTEAKAFGKIVTTLQQRGDIEIITVPRAGTPKKSYRLRGSHFT